MSNPFFSRSAAFNGRGPVAAPSQPVTPNGYPAMPGYRPGQYGPPTVSLRSPLSGSPVWRASTRLRAPRTSIAVA